MTSKKFNLNNEEIKKVVKNALIFAAPAILMFLTVLQSGGTFKEAFVAVQVWTLNTAIDLIRKFMASN